MIPLGGFSEDWEGAACLGEHPDKWFSDDDDTREEAARVCRTCPIFEKCQDYALQNKPKYGIWAAQQWFPSGQHVPVRKGAGAPCPRGHTDTYRTDRQFRCRTCRRDSKRRSRARGMK